MKMMKKQERQIRVPESKYREMKRALIRQVKAKRLAKELYLFFMNTK